MTSDSIAESIRRYLVDELGVSDTVSMDAPLVESGFLASTQLLDLVTFVEDEFGIVMRAIDASPENLRSIMTIAEVIRRRKSET